MRKPVNIVGNNIRILRERLGLSQSELAARVGIHPSALNKIESGVIRNSRYRYLVRIAKVLGVSLDELVGNEPPLRMSSEIREVVEILSPLPSERIRQMRDMLRIALQPA